VPVGAEAEPGWYVYGIVPVDVELAEDAGGVGEPPGRVRLVRHGEIAALVSEVDPEQPLRRPRDLIAHRDLLDATAAEVPVLPVRFGSVLADRSAVISELLAPHHDELAEALSELDGQAEYVIEARGHTNHGTVADMIVEEVGGYCAATRVLSPAPEDGDDGSGTGTAVAVLMPVAKQPDLEAALDNLARDWDGRAGLWLRGPVAAYDFLAPLTEEE
jgi:hypothetical protein